MLQRRGVVAYGRLGLHLLLVGQAASVRKEPQPGHLQGHHGRVELLGAWDSGVSSVMPCWRC